MKRLYTFMLAAVAVLLCGFNLKADTTLKLTVATADAVTYKAGYYGDVTPLPAGTTEISLPGGMWGPESLTLYSVDPYNITTLCFAGETEEISYYTSGNQRTIYAENSWDGKEIVISVVNLNEARTGSCTVNFTGDASKFTLTRNGNYAVELKEGANTVMFDPATESPLILKASNLPMAVANLNGEKLESVLDYSSYVYTINVKDGDNLELSTVWPDVTYPVTVTVTEGCEDAVKSLVEYVSYSEQYPVEGFKAGEPVQVAPGKQYQLNLNTDEFIINSVQAEGASINSSNRFVVVDQAVNITVNAAVKEVLKFTIIAEKDDMIQYDKNYVTTYLKAGENTIVPEESYWGGYNSIVFKAVSPYTFNRLVSADPDSYPDLVCTSSYGLTVYPDESFAGRVYTVDAINPDDFRNDFVTITVKDALSDDIKGAFYSGNSWNMIPLESGENLVKFDAATESTFKFYTSSYGSQLYKVTHNGVAVPCDADGNNIIEGMKNGDTVEIEGEWPADLTSTVTINIPEDAAKAIDYIQIGSSYPYEYVDLTNFVPGQPMTLAAGKKYSVSFDTDSYKVKGATINGKEVSSASWGFNFFLTEEPVEITIDAAPYGVLNFTINVADAASIQVWPGRKSYDQVYYDLVDGENNLTVSEQVAEISIKIADGYRMIGITDAEGNTCRSSNYDIAYAVTEGAVFNVEAKKIVYDQEFIVWYDTEDGLDKSWDIPYWKRGSESTYHYIETAGYYHVPFDSTNETEEYQLSIRSKDGYYYYKNGEFVEHNNSWGGTVCNQYFNPQAGDVHRVFVGGEPAIHDLVFNVEGSAVPTVKSDRVITHENFLDGLSLLHQTEVTIIAPEDATSFGVNVDGETIEPNENGHYVFTAVAPHVVGISGVNSIINVEAAEVAKDGAVYNLLGVKVAEKASDLKNLPAGIYVVDGQKKVVR